MWKKFRVAVLLLILLFVALSAYFDHRYATEWDNPLRVAIFPINADGSAVSEKYIQSLPTSGFVPIENFFTAEAGNYGVRLDPPVRFTLAPELRELPPMLASNAGRLGVVLWSLHMRYWVWRIHAPPGSEIRLFVLYHDPDILSALPHSVGVQKGLFGVVHAFADRQMEGSNDTVIAHELLHTLGATDKYSGGDNLPQYPDGFAEPDREPRYPQSFAELMAGRIPLSATEAHMPESLREVIIGPRTAAEIGWVKQ